MPATSVIDLNLSIKLVFMAAMVFSVWVVIPSSMHFIAKNDSSPFAFGTPTIIQPSLSPIPPKIQQVKTRTVKPADAIAKNDSSPFDDGILRDSNNRTAIAIANPPKIQQVKTRTVKPADAIAKNDSSATSDDGIDWSDRIFQRSGWDSDPIVIISHKLLFFTVPKNACTTFKKLFRRMMGHSDWSVRSPHDPSKNGLKYLGQYSKEEQREFMTSPSWTRAIFVRDPMERTLSAYMDKALKPQPKPKKPQRKPKPPVEGAYLKMFCCGMYGGRQTRDSRKSKIKACHQAPLFPYKNPLTQDNFPFETFVDSLMGPCKDPHWNPQHMRMGEATNWRHINFVGRFENKINDTHRLLKKIGAFEEFGASGWGTTDEVDEDGNAKSLAIFETNPGLHKTEAREKMDQHYTKKVRELVLQYYSRDYDMSLFNFTSPILKEP